MPREENGSVPQQEFGSGQPKLADMYRPSDESFDRGMKSHFDKLKELMRRLEQHLASQELDARQPRHAMEANGPASTETRERTESAATAVQAMRGDSFSSRQVNPGPNANSTSVGMMAEPPDLPYRDDVLVDNGDASPKPCLPSLEMRSPTAVGGLVPTGKTPTATETTVNEPLLQFYSTEKANCKKTSTPYVSYDSSVRNLLAVPPCLRVIETKPMQNRASDPGGSQGRLRACPVLGSCRALLGGEVVRAGAAGDELQRFFGGDLLVLLKQTRF